MKVDLPLETWTEIFGFLPRSQLVALSPHIGDRQFASFLEFFLHKCGKITLGKLDIRTSRNHNSPIVVLNDYEFPLAEGPIPSNIVDFKEIRLSHYDSSVLEFMQELQQNSMLENVNLNLFGNNSKDLLAFMATILPSIVSINSTKLSNHVLYKYAYSRLGEPMLKSTRVLETWNSFCIDWYCEWLCSPREDGKPRVLVLNIIYDSCFSIFIERIKRISLSALTVLHLIQMNLNYKMKKPTKN